MSLYISTWSSDELVLRYVNECNLGLGDGSAGKGPAAKTNNQSSLLGTSMVEEENHFSIVL